jgi:hypothetical protein
LVTPLCRKQKNKERPILTLGGKILKYKSDEKILRFTLSQSIQGSLDYEEGLKARALIAAAKIEKIGSTSGETV